MLAIDYGAGRLTHTRMWQDCLKSTLVSKLTMSQIFICRKMALISMDDLAELDDEQLDDDITDSSVPVDDEDQDNRLLAHWQAVGRAHQVSVPRGIQTCSFLSSVRVIQCQLQ